MITVKYCFLSLVSVLMIIGYGCDQISELAVKTGISDRYRDMEKGSWNNLKVGFLAFNKEKNIFEKQVYEINDDKTLLRLKESFHIVSAEHSHWGPAGRCNLMVLQLKNGEEWKLAFSPLQPEEMIAVSQGLGAYCLHVNNTFRQQLKNYLESIQKQRIEFDFSRKDVEFPKTFGPYWFSYIDFGNGKFCFWIDTKGRLEIKKLQPMFYLNSVSSNPYIRKKLQKLGVSASNINHTFLTYNSQGSMISGMEMSIIRGAFNESELHKLVQCAVAEKAILLVQSESEQDQPLTLCTDEESLIKAAQKQCLSGYISIIFNPSGQDVLSTK